MVKIKIIGPGLVVNGPVAVIYKALLDAGYAVKLEEFDGQHQYVAKENWPEKELKGLEERQGGMEVDVKVNPMPWGG